MALNPRVGELIAGEVRRMNELLPPALRVRRFVVLHKELDPDDAEITRTRKVRRRIVADKYAAIIAALYDPGAGDVDVRAAIRYEDGREAQVSRSLRIYSLDAETAAAALTGGAPAAAIADP
jgi:long-chain acyl-CoA synthetase